MAPDLVITVAADGTAPNGAEPSASTVMNTLLNMFSYTCYDDF